MRRDLPKPTPRPPEKFLYCSSPNSEIPDDNPLGLRDRITIADERKVIEINLYLYVTHTWIGDLVVGLERADIGSSVTILDRPGVPSSQNGCEHNNLIAIFDDRGSQAAEFKCAYSPAAISGTFKPAQPLSSFVDQPAAGEWEIHLIDNYPNDSGSLHEWCLEITLGDTLPPPTPTPTPFSPPASALIGDITGQNQAMPLDCESRSAVDWAAYFGFPINEYEFFYNLPQSDNPDTGFVGNVWGEWGNIPPDDYGVHAPPIAQLLRDYGLVASAYRSISWDDLRAEIASGRPAIVWIIGRINYGLPRFYTPSDGQTTVVARFEHTVIVIGYTETTVTVLNGEAIETYSLDQFLDSWSVLRNMAILARP